MRGDTLSPTDSLAAPNKVLTPAAPDKSLTPAALTPQAALTQTQVCRRAVVVGIPVLGVLAACAAPGDSTSASSSSDAAANLQSGGSASGSTGAAAPAGQVALADIPDGGSFSTDLAGTEVILVRDGEEVVAYDSACPHQGCAVTLQEGSFVCPCHGSTFTVDTGSVTKGPAQEGLKPVPAQVSASGMVSLG